MAGKGSRKDYEISKKNELDIEMCASDILSFVLRLCDFPEEKIKSKEGKPNVYSDGNFVRMAGATVLNISLSMRDEWKTMFESRLKNSGFDTIEKIEKYFKSFFRISREFQKGNTLTKIQVSLAAYSEVMLFLNSKGIEFDYAQLLNLWNLNYREHIAHQQNTGEELNNLFIILSDLTRFIKWVTSFNAKVANPYGCRNDVSEIFRLHSERLKKTDDAMDYQLAEMLARKVSLTKVTDEESAPVLPPGFDSPAVLPGDRKSPEPPKSSESSPCEGKKRSRRRSTRSTGVSVCESKGRQRRKTASDQEIENRLGQMSLTSENNPQENDPKQRKPKGRKSF